MTNQPSTIHSCDEIVGDPSFEEIVDRAYDTCGLPALHFYDGWLCPRHAVEIVCSLGHPEHIIAGFLEAGGQCEDDLPCCGRKACCSCTWTSR